jgi:hypothetical protein
MSHRRFTFMRWTVAAAVATLAVTALAPGSQAGDNGRLPSGAGSDIPRQAIPNETANDPPIDYRSGVAYYSARTAYDRALYYCDEKPLEQQDACRDAADARYGYPDPGYVAQAGLPAARPPAPSLVYRGNGPAPEYSVHSSPNEIYWSGGTAEVDRCTLNYGAGPECLHGGLAGN